MDKIDYENLAKLNEPFFSEYESVFSQVARKGWYVLGEQVSKFENEFCEFTGGKYFLGLANGLDALTLSLRYFDFPAGSEVLVPSNTYIATILSIVQNNLKPILVEPNIHTYNIDPNLIEAQITPNTKAIMVVHLYGKSCEMDPILSICKKYNLALIEDCAQAHGAKYKGKQVGTFGDFGAFSFYPTKNLGALGDGGGVICKDDIMYQKMKALRNYGSHQKYYNLYIGTNSRLDEVQAAFLRIKLKSLSQINEHKRNLARIYSSELCSSIIKPLAQNDFEDVFHIYNIRTSQRDDLKQYLFNHGIGTEIHYPVSPNKQKAMTGLITQETPISEEIHQTTLSLPISFFHTPKDIEYICKTINSFFK